MPGLSCSVRTDHRRTNAPAAPWRGLPRRVQYVVVPRHVLIQGCIARCRRGHLVAPRHRQQIVDLARREQRRCRCRTRTPVRSSRTDNQLRQPRDRHSHQRRCHERFDQREAARGAQAAHDWVFVHGPRQCNTLATVWMQRHNRETRAIGWVSRAEWTARCAETSYVSRWRVEKPAGSPRPAARSRRRRGRCGRR